MGCNQSVTKTPEIDQTNSEEAQMQSQSPSKSNDISATFKTSLEKSVSQPAANTGLDETLNVVIGQESVRLPERKSKSKKSSVQKLARKLKNTQMEDDDDVSLGKRSHPYTNPNTMAPTPQFDKDEFVNKTDYIFLLDKISELSKIVRVLGRRIGEIEDKTDFDAKSAGYSNILRSQLDSENVSKLSISGNRFGMTGSSLKPRTKQSFMNPGEIKKSMDRASKEVDRMNVSASERLKMKRQAIKRLKIQKQEELEKQNAISVDSNSNLIR